MDINFKLPVLSYSYDSLEPFFDTKTMEIHYTKHHQAYLNNVISILKNTEYCKKSLKYIIKNIKEINISSKKSLINNIGGHINHSFFWEILKKNTVLPDSLKISLDNSFGSINEFKKYFEYIAVNHFGSGWVWLIKKNNILQVISTNNQDSPIVDLGNFDYQGGIPLIGLDLWEHSYYLKYQNRKLEYIKSFWNVLNWNKVNNLFLIDN